MGTIDVLRVEDGQVLEITGFAAHLAPQTQPSLVDDAVAAGAPVVGLVWVIVLPFAWWDSVRTATRAARALH